MHCFSTLLPLRVAIIIVGYYLNLYHENDWEVVVKMSNYYAKNQGSNPGLGTIEIFLLLFLPQN